MGIILYEIIMLKGLIKNCIHYKDVKILKRISRLRRLSSNYCSCGCSCGSSSRCGYVTHAHANVANVVVGHVFIAVFCVIVS